MELLALFAQFGTLFLGLYTFSENTNESFAVMVSLGIVALNAGFLLALAYQLTRQTRVILFMSDRIGSLSSPLSSPRRSMTQLSDDAPKAAAPKALSVEMSPARAFSHAMAPPPLV